MSSFDVFLSYNSADRAAVKEIALRLEREGIKPWFDDQEMAGGDLILDRIEKGLASCLSCAVFLGPHGFGRWQLEEIRAAIARRADSARDLDAVPFRVIPVLLPGARQEAYQKISLLQNASAVQFLNSLRDEQAFDRLVCAIRGKAPSGGEGETPLIDEVPYRGLECFEEKHAAFFFGRRALTEHLVEKLERAGARKKRLLAILGPSGCGKSSVARAGLLRALRQRARPSDWKIAVLRPESNPLESLAIALMRLGACGRSPREIQSLEQDLLTREDTLHLATRLILQDNPESQLLFLIDQFEEVFTFAKRSVPGLGRGSRGGDPACEALIRNLFHAATIPAGRTNVVLTLRTDFLGECAAYPEFASLISAQSVVVGPMSEEELREAIQAPAQLAGCEVSPDLGQALLADVRQAPGGLPLLQDALLELWNRRTGRYITLEQYDAIGRLKGALEARANAVLTSLENQNPGITNLCRKIFLRLVQPGEGTADTRNRVSLRELLTLGDTAEVQGMIFTLASKEARLLVIEGDSARPDNVCVEVAHETLISHWPQLRAWIEADRPGFRLRHRLTQSAAEWKANRRDRSYLYTGTRLAQIEEWREDHEDEPGRLEKRFLRASLALRSREEKLRSEAHARELAQANALAEAQRLRAEEERKRADAERQRADAERSRAVERVQRLKLLWGLGVLLAVAVCLLFAAQAQRKVAQARMLINRALSELEVDPQRSVLTATEAALAASGEGEDVLRRSLFESQLRAKIGPHDDAVVHAIFSPNGQRVATGGWRGETFVWDKGSNTVLRLPNGHASRVNCLRFSLDGHRLLTAGDDKTVRIREPETGRLLSLFTNRAGSVQWAVFSPDDQNVVSCGRDSDVWVWEAGHPSRGVRLPHSTAVSRAVFHPDGRRVATADVLGQVFVWSWQEQKVVASCRLAGPVRDLMFSLGGAYLLAAGAEGAQIWNWDSPQGEMVRLPHFEGVKRAVWSSDEELVLTLTDQGVVWLWAWRSARPRFQLRHPQRITDARFSNASEFIVTAGLDSVVRVWSTEDGSLFAVLKGHEAQVNSAFFAPDDRSITTASDDGTARVWELRLGERRLLPNKARTAILSGDASYVMLADDDAVYIHGTHTDGAVVGPIELEGIARRAVMSPDARWLAAPVENRFYLRDLSSPEPREFLKTLPEPLARVAISNDGTYAIAFSAGGIPYVWEVKSRQEPNSPADEEHHPVDLVLISPDSSLVLTVDAKHRCVVRDRKDWRKLFEWTAPSQPLCAAFDPEGRRIAVGCRSGLAFVWDWKQERNMATLVGHAESVRGVGFSPDGKFIVTAGGDKTARVWNALTGVCFAVLRGHVQPLLAAGFGPDSKTIVTVGDGDGVLRRYECPECTSGGALLELARSPRRSIKSEENRNR